MLLAEPTTTRKREAKPESLLRRFADNYRVKITNTGAELVAPGKFGEIADNYGDGLLRLRLLAVPRGSGRHDPALRIRCRRAEAAGMTLHQRGGAESIWLFDPANESHCRLAIELVRPRRKRKVSPEQREILAARMTALRAPQATVTIA